MNPGCELILGGARSGKSRVAEDRAEAWLAERGDRQATLVATAFAGDSEMTARIERHRVDRARRGSRLETVEASVALPARVRELSAPCRLLVVDCLTLWSTQILLPLDSDGLDEAGWQREEDEFIDALHAATGPVVIVSNEIGLGVLPMGAEARACVDALGRLHQRVATACNRVTLMIAGCELAVKGPAR